MEEENKLVNEIHELYERKYGGMSSDEIIVYLLEKLDEGTSRLNYLTKALIFLTVFLGLVAVSQIITIMVVQPRLSRTETP